jgi:hypothetical protein
MITKNIATCIKGLRLLGDGKAQEARDLMKDCTAHDLREAITILEDQALWAMENVTMQVMMNLFAMF